MLASGSLPSNIKERGFMQNTISYKTIFGSIVMQLNQKENERRNKEKRKKIIKEEKELFEMIDDYIEQA